MIEGEELNGICRRYKPLLRRGDAVALMRELGLTEKAFCAMMRDEQVAACVKWVMPGGVRAFYRREELLKLVN